MKDQEQPSRKVDNINNLLHVICLWSRKIRSDFVNNKMKYRIKINSLLFMLYYLLVENSFVNLSKYLINGEVSKCLTSPK